MAERDPEPRDAEEWRVEVALDQDHAEDEHGQSLGERLRSLDLDDEARKRLGGSVIVTRDGPHLFLYAWHETSAREAERVVRELMAEDGLSGEVSLMRWHPVEEAWRPADEPQPETDHQVAAEQERHEQAGEREGAETGAYPWEVVIDLPDLRSTTELAKQLRERGLPVKRRFKYLLVGTPTEEDAIELGSSFEGNVPEGSHVGVRANPHDLPAPAFVWLGALKPGVMRDLGL
ncbi:MAG: hypothetical protein M3M99_07830 [Actinomycetota bacterium]|nr:hypothetical protein [Actinomycetota bacterium]